MSTYYYNEGLTLARLADTATGSARAKLLARAKWAFRISSAFIGVSDHA